MIIRFAIALLVLLLATTISAKSLDNKSKIQATKATDGVLFEATDKDLGLSMSLVGPEGYRTTKSFTNAELAFIDINSVDGAALEDGFYKYEIKTIPAVIISREESAKMPDRNDLKWKSVPKASALSGSFRVVNGQLLDEQLEEFDSSVTLENQQ